MARFPFFYWGLLLVLAGFSVYLFAVVLAVVLIGLPETISFRRWDQWLVWYSGVPTLLGLLFVCVDLGFMLPRKRRGNRQVPPPPPDASLTVALTAYNGEQSIGEAVRDFFLRPEVKRVIVVSNNSNDETLRVAAEAGASVIDETHQGYGYCVYRYWQEALRFGTRNSSYCAKGTRPSGPPTFLSSWLTCRMRRL